MTKQSMLYYYNSLTRIQFVCVQIWIEACTSLIVKCFEKLQSKFISCQKVRKNINLKAMLLWIIKVIIIFGLKFLELEWDYPDWKKLVKIKTMLIGTWNARLRWTNIIKRGCSALLCSFILPFNNIVK